MKLLDLEGAIEEGYIFFCFPKRKTFFDKCFLPNIFYDLRKIQFLKMNMDQLLNKPYVNWVTLTGQNQP